MSKLDWANISQALYGDPKSFALDNSEVKLLLRLLADRAIFQGAWRNNDIELNSAEWDTVQAFVDALIRKLMEGSEANKTMELLMTVTRASAQSLSGSGSFNTMQFNRVEYDPLGLWSVSDWKFTVPENGVYIIGGEITIENLNTPEWARLQVAETEENPLNMLHDSGKQVMDATSDDITCRFEGPAYLLSTNKLRWFASHGDSVNRSTTGYFKSVRAWVYKL